MQRVNITDELDFSRIVYGMWRVADDADTSIGNVTAKIKACLDQGITTFDQADIYGDYGAEAVLGAALQADSGLRKQMEIVTKCDIVAPCGKYADVPVKYYDTSADHITASVDASLRNMATDYIDMLLIHRPDPLMNHHETGSALDALVTSGKVGAVGVSNFKPWDWSLLQSAMTTPLATNQIEFSLGTHEAMTNGDLAFHQQGSHSVMAWSPLGGGGLMSDNSKLGKALDAVANRFDTDRAMIAVAWIMAHPAGILPVMGTNNLSRIATLSKAASINMDRITWFELYTAALGREVA
jgi:predicted oxidoreductase